MSTYGSIREDVKAYLGDDAEDFDIDGIVSDIRAAGVTDIDDMGEDDFQAIVKAHDESGKPSSLAALRADAGMTQVELAAAVGVGQGRISEWESGAREMSATACWKVARALGTDPGRIVEAVATRDKGE
ncbi:MAG: helix-turn-helix domain-containing protein [Olsenella sp.]